MCTSSLAVLRPRLAVLVPFLAVVATACGDDAGGGGGSGGATGAGGETSTTATITSATTTTTTTGADATSSSTGGTGGGGGAGGQGGDGQGGNASGGGGDGGAGQGQGGDGQGGSGGSALPACDDYRAVYNDLAASLDCSNPAIESPTYCDQFAADPCLDERTAYWTCATGELPDASCDCVEYQGQLLLICGVCAAELDALTGCSAQ